MTKHKRRLRLESQVNPFATQQHHARSLMYLLQARASPDTYLSFTFTFTFLSSSGGGRRQHFSFNSGTAPAASLIMELFQHSSPGGLLWCFGDLPPRPQTGIIRPVHRAHLCHANSGEIPLFESHLQRWNMFLSKHHSQAPPSVEQTLGRQLCGSALYLVLFTGI